MVVQVLFDQNMLLHDCLLGWLDFSTPFLFILLHEERGIIFFQLKSLCTHFDLSYNEKLTKNLNLSVKSEIKTSFCSFNPDCFQTSFLT